jgi:hypothetical protein
MANCYICGSENATQPLALKDSFTAHTRCKCPNSKNLCQRCFDCIEGQYKQCWYYHPSKEKWSKLWGRNWSWLISSNLSFPMFSEGNKEDGLLEVRNLPTREQIREWLIDPPNPPFTICIADSGQKHTYPFAVESNSRELFPVLFEETLIYCNRQSFIEVLNNIELLITMGFTKTEIQLGDYSPSRMIKMKLSEFLPIEQSLQLTRGTDIFNLAIFVAKKSVINSIL